MLERDLAKAGFPVLSDKELPVAESWVRAVELAIKETDVVLALMSPSFFESRWAQHEIAAAAVGKKPIIPVKLSQCEPTGYLGLLQFVDLTMDRERGIEQVAEAARILASPANG